MLYPDSSREFSPSRRLAALGAAAFALSVAVLLGSQAQAQSPALIEAAKREGRVVAYGDNSTLSALAPAFEKRYPGIRVSIITGASWTLYNRFLSEKAAGRIGNDVFYQAEDTLQVANDAGHLETYRFENETAFPSTVRPGNGNYILGNFLVGIFTWNKDVLGKEPTPQDWNDFLNPPKAWKDQIAIADPSSGSAIFTEIAGLYYGLGADGAAGIFNGIRKSGAEIAATLQIVNQKLAIGERGLSPLNTTTHIGQLLRDGAPIGFSVPKSGTIAQYNAGALIKGSPNPNAGKLFLEFVLSEEGQKLLSENGYYVLREGIAPPKFFPPISEIKFFKFDLRNALSEREKILAWWRAESGLPPK